MVQYRSGEAGVEHEISVKIGNGTFGIEGQLTVRRYNNSSHLLTSQFKYSAEIIVGLCTVLLKKIQAKFVWREKNSID